MKTICSRTASASYIIINRSNFYKSFILTAIALSAIALLTAGFAAYLHLTPVLPLSLSYFLLPSGAAFLFLDAFLALVLFLCKTPQIEAENKAQLKVEVKNIHQKTLTSLLYEGQKNTHKKAIKDPFLNGLIRNEFCAKAYTAYLCNLFIIHEAIEQLQQRIIEEHGEEFFIFPILFRSRALLEDIKTWSIFNDFWVKFADYKPDSEEFLSNVRSLASNTTNQLVEHIHAIPEENIFLLVAILYTLYGTILSGGQIVKKGLVEGFMLRIKEAEVFVDHEPSKNYFFSIAHDKEQQMLAAEESVKFFNFGTDFSIKEFKTKWHASLDSILDLMQFKNEEERTRFIDRLIDKSIFTMQAFLQMIQEIVSNLK